MTFASLPMYDLPEVRSATDDWWRGLARAFRRQGLADVPDSLDRDGDYEAKWLRLDLLLSQTCGYPLTARFQDRLRLVATPCYQALGCEGSSYRSAFVVHRDNPAKALLDLKGGRCAINAKHSQSGYNCLRFAVAELPERQPSQAFFSQVIESGSHHGSMAFIADGRADLAAIDAVTYAMTVRYRPDAVAPLRVLDWSAPAPGLPLVTASATSPDTLERLRAGLATANQAPALAATREALLIEGFEVLPLEAYDVIPAMEEAARQSGYGEVR